MGQFLRQAVEEGRGTRANFTMAFLCAIVRRAHVCTHRQIAMGLALGQGIGYSRWMDQAAALDALAALAHPTRLEAFRRLVAHEPAGLSTGQLVAQSGLTQSTFSTHLVVLVKAGLVRSEKAGRNQIQRAEIDALRALMLFLARDCCGGRAELCAPLLAELTCC